MSLLCACLGGEGIKEWVTEEFVSHKDTMGALTGGMDRVQELESTKHTRLAEKPQIFTSHKLGQVLQFSDW